MMDRTCAVHAGSRGVSLCPGEEAAEPTQPLAAAFKACLPQALAVNHMSITSLLTCLLPLFCWDISCQLHLPLLLHLLKSCPFITGHFDLLSGYSDVLSQNKSPCQLLTQQPDSGAHTSVTSSVTKPRGQGPISLKCFWMTLHKHHLLPI